MTVQQLVGRYEAGAITAPHLFMQCLHMVDPGDPKPVLGAIPRSLLGKFARFLNEYRVGAMVTTFGLLPANDQVTAAKDWLERAGIGAAA